MYVQGEHTDFHIKNKKFFTIIGEKFDGLTSTESGQSDGNKGRRQREAMGRRQQEAVAVSMIGGPYAQKSPSIASANVGIRTGR